MFLYIHGLYSKEVRGPCHPLAQVSEGGECTVDTSAAENSTLADLIQAYPQKNWGMVNFLFLFNIVFLNEESKWANLATSFLNPP